MIKKLIKLSDVLDEKGLFKESKVIDAIIATNPRRSLEGLLLVADSLDAKGLLKEANYLDAIIKESGDAAPFTPDMFRSNYDPDSNKVVEVSDEDLELDARRSKLLMDLKNKLKEKHGKEKGLAEYISILEKSAFQGDPLDTGIRGEIDLLLHELYKLNEGEGRYVPIFREDIDREDLSGITAEDITLEKESLESLNKIIRLSNHLDKIGLYKEADYLDSIIKKSSELPTSQQVASISEVQNAINMADYWFETIEKNDRGETIEPSIRQDYYLYLPSREIASTLGTSMYNIKGLVDRAIRKGLTMELFNSLSSHHWLKKGTKIEEGSTRPWGGKGGVRPVTQKDLPTDESVGHSMEKWYKEHYKPSMEKLLNYKVPRKPDSSLGKKSNNILRSIVRLSNHLDKIGLHKEADYLDGHFFFKPDDYDDKQSNKGNFLMRDVEEQREMNEPKEDYRKMKETKRILSTVMGRSDFSFPYIVVEELFFGNSLKKDGGFYSPGQRGYELDKNHPAADGNGKLVIPGGGQVVFESEDDKYKGHTLAEFFNMMTRNMKEIEFDQGRKDLREFREKNPVGPAPYDMREDYGHYEHLRDNLPEGKKHLFNSR